MAQGFLPVTKKELLETGVSQPDFVYAVGDAYRPPQFRGCNHLSSAGITGLFRGNAAAAGLAEHQGHHAVWKAQTGIFGDRRQY